MLWLYLDFYQLTLDAALPEPQSPPMVVYHQADNRIMQCCKQAISQGVDVGMGMAQAASLCPSLKVINYQPEQESGQLQALAHRLYQVVTDIVVLPPDNLAIRLDSHLRYYDGLEPLWLTLKNELHEARRHYHYASGWSIEAAKVLAKARCNRLLSEPAAIRHCLHQAHIQHTDLTDKQKLALNRVGIRTLSALLAMPATELGKRFHNDLIRYVCALNGTQQPKVRFFHPEESYRRYQELSFEADKSADVLPWIGILLNELAIFLRLRNKLTAHIQIRLYFRDEPPQTLDVHAATSLTRAGDWQPLVELKVEKVVLPAPVVAVELSSGALEDLLGQSNDFFQDRFQYFNQMQLIGRLQARLGHQRVWQPRLQNDHRFEPVSPFPAERQNTPPMPGGPQGYPSGHPALSHFQPTPLTQACRITFGPVRLHTGWWDNQPVCRDYYIAVAENGQHLHIFRDPQQGWFVQGWFC